MVANVYGTNDLLCLPSDVYDILGSEGVQLRLDDHNLATGQIIETVVDNPIGSSTLQITALQYPLLAGSVLNFDGGGMAQAQDVTLTQTAPTGSTTLNVTTLTFDVPAEAQARDSGVNLATAIRLIKACNYGTAQTKMYCSPRYNFGDLGNSRSVNRWASTLAARWLSRRRAQPCPKSLDEEAKECLEEMKMVMFGKLAIEDIGTRTASWPFLTNVTVDIRYDYAKMRVEQPLSDPTPTQYAQFIDWNSALYLEIW